MAIEGILVVEPNLFRLADQILDEAIMDRLVYIHALHGVADLAGRVHAAAQHRRRRTVDVGSPGHDRRVLATELEKTGNQTLGAGERNLPTVRDTARKTDEI